MLPRHFRTLVLQVSYAQLFCSLQPVQADVVINEIHYHPADKTRHTEFIELHNPGDVAVDLSGWRLTGAVRLLLPNGTSLIPRGFVVLARDPKVLAEDLGVDAAIGPWQGRLSNEGEEIVLENAKGHTMDSVSYTPGFPWPPTGGEIGSSIELVHPGPDNALGGNWRLAEGPGLLIDEGAGFIHRPGGPNLAAADAALWNYHPENRFPGAYYRLPKGEAFPPIFPASSNG